MVYGFVQLRQVLFEKLKIWLLGILDTHHFCVTGQYYTVLYCTVLYGTVVLYSVLYSVLY